MWKVILIAAALFMLAWFVRLRKSLRKAEEKDIYNLSESVVADDEEVKDESKKVQ